MIMLPLTKGELTWSVDAKSNSNDCMPIKYLGAIPTKISISLMRGNFLIMPLNGIGKAVAYPTETSAYDKNLVLRSNGCGSENLSESNPLKNTLAKPLFIVNS